MKVSLHRNVGGLLGGALWLASLACRAPSPAGSPLPDAPPPTGPILATAPAAASPETTHETATGAAPSPASPSAVAEIVIRGDPAFVEQTQNALALLAERAPDAYDKVMRFVGEIEQGDRSGMWAYEDPPRYAVSLETAFTSLTWYASTIAHDATHSELYHEYLAAHPGGDVPDDVWTGFEAERFCNAYQLDVLTRIGGPPHEVDYLAGLSGTHCDVDGDLDCDWDDYQGRDW
jgi:hypothetical protein